MLKPSVIINFFFLLLTLIGSTFSARILGIITIPTFSHQAVFRQFWRELSLRGHQVVVLTTHPMKDHSLSNLTEIDLYSSYEFYMNSNGNKIAEDGFTSRIYRDAVLIHKLNEHNLQHPEVQQLINNKTEHFDVVLVEYIYPTMLQFSIRFKCPLIHLLPFDAFSIHYHNIGNPWHPIANPDFLLQLSSKTNFFNKLTSVVNELFRFYINNFVSLRLERTLTEKYFDKGYASSYEIIRNTSMMFVNSNLILHRLRARMPNVISIGGGLHFKEPKRLPKALQYLLDSSTNGAIYFSLGSNVKSENLAKDTIRVLLEIFAELPYMVLWKFGEDLPGKPNNVFISKWFPQQDILRHPNVKLFISQGGFHSVTEGIHNQIPIIAIPFMWDQYHNARQIVNKGLGLQADHRSLDKESFKNMIVELMDNPEYRNKVKEMAGLAKYHPMTGLERAVWWTEHVIRYKGAKHLRSPTVNLPLHKEVLLDVVGFCILLIVVLTYLLVKLVRLLCSYWIH